MSGTIFFHTPRHPNVVEARTMVCDEGAYDHRYCGGILDYVSHCWWRCRRCGRWHEVAP